MTDKILLLSLLWNMIFDDNWKTSPWYYSSDSEDNEQLLSRQEKAYQHVRTLKHFLLRNSFIIKSWCYVRYLANLAGSKNRQNSVTRKPSKYVLVTTPGFQSAASGKNDFLTKKSILKTKTGDHHGKTKRSKPLHHQEKTSSRKTTSRTTNITHQWSKLLNFRGKYYLGNTISMCSTRE